MARRSRVALGAACVCLPAGVAFALRYWLVLDDPVRLPVSLATLTISLAVLPAFLILRRGHLVSAVHLMLAGIGLVVLAVAYHLGGTHASVLYWLVVIPCVSAFAGSARSAVLSAVGCQLALALLLGLELTGHRFPEPPPKDPLLRIWLGSVCGLTLVLCALMVVFDRAKEATLARLRRANQALVIARDRARQASEGKSEFLARVSQELRTPMTALLGFSELLASRVDRASPAAESAAIVRSNARHLLDVIDDILDLSKIEAGLLEIDLRACDPVAIARDVLSLMAIRAQDPHVTLRESFAQGLDVRVVADPKRLRQILINLVGNAVKFSEGGEVRVGLEVVDGESDAPALRFEVRDTGIGMSPTELSGLFQAFRQADASTTRRFGGTGLGLSISRHLCERMGGTIGARSTPGAGSTFWVRLPLHAGAAEDPAHEAARERRAPDPETLDVERLDGAPRVLIADGVADNRDLIAQLLSEAGARVAVAESGRDALARARSAGAPFDAILLDLEMRDGDGLELARTLRSEGYRGTLLALSARAMAGEQHRCQDAGFDALVAKPFEAQTLLRAIVGARDGSEVASPEPDAPAVAPPEPARGRDGRFESCVRFFLPARLRDDPTELQRARLTLALILSPVPIVSMWVLFLPRVMDPDVGPAIAGLLALTVPLLLTIPLALRASGSITLAANAMAAYAFGLIGGVAYCTGGATAPGAFWLLVLPLCSPVLGLRSTVAWASLVIVQYAGFYALERHGGAPSWLLPEATALVSIVSASSLNGLATVLMLVYERHQRRSIREVACANRDLAAAHDASERATKSKSDFVAHVSHEMRTPMTAILGFSEMMVEEWRESPDSQELCRIAGILERNGRQLLSLINGLLDLSRVDAGRVELERIAFSPQEMCTEVAELLQARAEAKDLRLRVECAPETPDWVQGDPTRVRQILLSLMSNAVRFTQVGGVSLCVRAQGERLSFGVADTGIGLAPGELEALFQPFVQASGDRPREEPGSGLSLAISRRLARLMGGDIHVTSQVGEGSCFTFELPVARCSAAAKPNPEPIRRPAAAPVGGARLLLAEDGRDNQVLLTRVLRKAGADVTLVENGQQALDTAQSAHERGEPFDLVLMDMQMPVLDGYTAVRTLRQRGYPGPILALTAHAFAEERLRCLEAGCDGFATKPIVRDELVALVAHWTGGERVRSEA